MTNIRNILLIGRTGSGKSTLANVIVGITEVNKFKESEYAVSETKKVQTEEFMDIERGIKYRIIDTVGIGDTEMSLEKDLYDLAELSYSVKNGLNQVLFVTRGELTEEVKSTYNLLKEVIFGEDIIKYTTFVRTRFDNFEDDSKCEKDKKELIKSSGKFKEVVEKCEVIHLNSPSVDLFGEGKNIKKQIELNKEIREISRDKMLKHLSKCVGVCNFLVSDLDDYSEWTSKKRIIKKFIQHFKEKSSKLSKEKLEKINKIEKKIEMEFFAKISDLEKQNRDHQIKLTETEEKNQKLINELNSLNQQIKENGISYQQKLTEKKKKINEFQNQLDQQVQESERQKKTFTQQLEKIKNILSFDLSHFEQVDSSEFDNKDSFKEIVSEIKLLKEELEKHKEPKMGFLKEEEKKETESVPFSAVIWRANKGGYSMKEDDKKKIFDKIKNWRKEKIQYLLDAWPKIIGERGWFWWGGWYDEHYAFYEEVKEVAEKRLDELKLKGEVEQDQQSALTVQPAYGTPGSSKN